MSNEKIIQKIKNLLKLAEDGNQDEESQTAILMAQKLMLRYKISRHELSSSDADQIVIRSLSVYKRIYWWERELAKVIAENFRVMYYMQSNKFPHKESVQRKIVLMGYQEDVDLAHDIYQLAEQTMRHYASLYIKDHDSKESANNLTRRYFYQGFIDGLDEKFKIQRENLSADNDQYALVLQVPSDVKERFDRDIRGVLSFESPEFNRSALSYQKGFDHGNALSLNTRQLESK